MTKAADLSKTGSLVNSSGQIDLTTGVTGALPVANGGTGTTTQAGAANAILPSQTGNTGKYLTTDGTNASWGTVTQLPIVLTPTNVSPANASTDILPGQVLTASSFYALYGFTFANAQWQISTSSGFGTTVYDSGTSGAASTTLTVSSAYITTGTTYYWRVRYKASDGTWSEYSSASSFTTAAAFTVAYSYLLVGGGGGAATSSVQAGGGGAGEVESGSGNLIMGTTYTITVGGGGGGNTAGSNSTVTGSGFTTITGSGGGGGSGATGGTSGNGFGPGASGIWGGQGGGGASAAGSSSYYGSRGGSDGGAGLANSITGSSVTYGGGGGGNYYSFNGDYSSQAGFGGSGGGGNGANSNGTGSNGSANTGGGAGGRSASGGSGIVILSVPTAKYTGNVTGTYTTGTNGSNTWIRWTGSGTYTA